MKLNKYFNNQLTKLTELVLGGFVGIVSAFLVGIHLNKVSSKRFRQFCQCISWRNSKS